MGGPRREIKKGGEECALGGVRLLRVKIESGQLFAKK
jgi:hypothetical protein